MESKHYRIPTNYLESGYILNGRIAKRNAIEAVIMALFGFIACRMLKIPMDANGLTWYIVIILPLAMLGAAGVKDDPLSVFLLNVYRWTKNRKPMFYNHSVKASRLSSAEAVMEETNGIAETISRIWEETSRQMKERQRVEYVEGENFVFAADPEMEAIQEAEERIFGTDESDDKKKKNVAQKAASGSGADETTKDLMEDVFDGIVLQDLGE